MPSLEKETDYSVPALQRGLSVLGLFDAHTRSLGINDIAEQLGVSNSAIYRILYTLTDMGYLKNTTITMNWAPRSSPRVSATWPAATLSKSPCRTSMHCVTARPCHAT